MYPSHPLPEGVEVLATQEECQYCEYTEEVKFLFSGATIAKLSLHQNCAKSAQKRLTDEGRKLLIREMEDTKRQLALGIL